MVSEYIPVGEAAYEYYRRFVTAPYPLPAWAQLGKPEKIFWIGVGIRAGLEFADIRDRNVAAMRELLWGVGDVH